MNEANFIYSKSDANMILEKKEKIVNSIKERVRNDIILTINKNTEVPKNYKHLHDSSHPKAS